jgi:hypothetical protein
MVKIKRYFHRKSVLLKSWRETSNRSFGLFAHCASTPAARASPNSAIIIRRLMEKYDRRGGKGLPPLGCLPSGGERGVTLIAASDNKRITGARGFQ